MAVIPVAGGGGHWKPLMVSGGGGGKLGTLDGSGGREGLPDPPGRLGGGKGGDTPLPAPPVGGGGRGPGGEVQSHNEESTK